MTSFFEGHFFGKEFFTANAPKKGSNWSQKRKEEDEQIVIAFVKAYMQHDYNERRNYHG